MKIPKSHWSEWKIPKTAKKLLNLNCTTTSEGTETKRNNEQKLSLAKCYECKGCEFHGAEDYQDGTWAIHC